jgi:S1-C subfamily serine protease
MCLMKRMLWLVIVIALLSVGGVTAQTGTLTPDQIERIARSVVEIGALKQGQVAGIGSGTIVSPDGLIFTNRHVVEGGDDFLILVLQDPSEPPVESFLASVIGVSDTIDFALLQIDRDLDGRQIDTAQLNLPTIPLAASRARLGETISVFGYPGLSEGYLVYTTGAVSGVQNETVNGQRVPLWYNTDTEISPGNSGGTVVNQNGEYIGIPTAVRAENTTGGRLGAILSLPAILAELGMTAQEINAGQVDRVEAPQTGVGGGGDVLTGVGLDYSLNPNYGIYDLRAGFEPDPFTLDVTAGGDIDTATLGLGDQCVGFATTQPDIRLNWSGNSQLLRIFFAADSANGDTALLINDPQGAWYCNDDSARGNLNPMVDLVSPLEGQYDIWIGSVADADVDGTLYITEQTNVAP